MLAVTLVLPEANVANSSIQLDAEARAQKLVWSGVALGGRLKGCTVCVRRGDDGEDCDDTARNVTLSTGQFYINVPVPSRAERSAWTGAEPQLVLQPGPGCVNAETGTPVPAPLRCASFRAGTLPRVPKGTPKIRNVCSILTDLHAELVDRWGLSAAEANARLLTALRILPRVTLALSLWPKPSEPKPEPNPNPISLNLILALSLTRWTCSRSTRRRCTRRAARSASRACACSRPCARSRCGRARWSRSSSSPIRLAPTLA